MLYDDDLIGRLSSKHIGRPEWAVPEYFRTVLALDRQGQRAWMRASLESIPEPGRAKLKARLESARDFSTAYHELCVTAILQEAGYQPEYEREMFGTTPDLLIPGPPSVMIEMWTRSRPDPIKKSNRRWEVLAQLINEIPVPAGLMIVEPSRESAVAPDSRSAKVIARSLRHWLLSGTAAGTHDVGGFRFAIMFRMPGLYAALAPPYGGGTVTSDIVIQVIAEKTSKYKAAAESGDARLIVVLASEPAASLTLDLLKSALAGKQAVSTSFSVGTPGLLSRTTVPMRATETPEVFDPALSAVAWLNPGISDPGTLVVIRALAAKRPVQVSGSLITFEALNNGLLP